MIERCKICNANLAMVGIRHRCAPMPEWAGGVVKPNLFEDAARGRDPVAPSKKSSVARVKPSAELTVVLGGGSSPQGSDPDQVGPIADAGPKLGRPRLGEKRAKPWLDTDPPMSKTTWYRRQKEQKAK